MRLLSNIPGGSFISRRGLPEDPGYPSRRSLREARELTGLRGTFVVRCRSRILDKSSVRSTVKADMPTNASYSGDEGSLLPRFTTQTAARSASISPAGLPTATVGLEAAKLLGTGLVHSKSTSVEKHKARRLIRRSSSSTGSHQDRLQSHSNLATLNRVVLQLRLAGNGGRKGTLSHGQFDDGFPRSIKMLVSENGIYLLHSTDGFRFAICLLDSSTTCRERMTPFP